MEGLELLAICLSVLFGLGMIFSILLWCRSWRKEEREQTDLQIKALRGVIRKLSDTVEMLDHTTASLQTADGLLTQQLEDLRSSVTRLQNIRVPREIVPTTSINQASVAEKPEGASPSATRVDTPATSSGPAYDAVSGLLERGKSTLEIAHALDIGIAEVRMIARIHATHNPDEPDSKELIERG